MGYHLTVCRTFTNIIIIFSLSQITASRTPQDTVECMQQIIQMEAGVRILKDQCKNIFLNQRNNPVVSRDTCGGVITQESGIIQYKLNRLYINNEYCAWTILTNGTSLELKLTKYSFYFHQNVGISILDINPTTGDLKLIGRFSWHMEFPVQKLTTSSGQAILVFTTSYLTLLGRGFELQFKASGQRQNKPVYTATHDLQTVNSKNIDISQFNGPNAKKIHHIITSNLLCIDGVLNVTVTEASFAKLDEYCAYETFKAYELIHGSRLRQIGELPSTTDKANCPNLIRIKVAREWFQSTTRTYIAVLSSVRRKISTKFTSNRKVTNGHVPNWCDRPFFSTSD